MEATKKKPPDLNNSCFEFYSKQAARKGIALIDLKEYQQQQSHTAKLETKLRKIEALL